MTGQIVIADASCLITLENIGELEILPRLYGDILATPDVIAEFGSPVPPWITIKSPAPTERFNVIRSKLDAGEASSIALALDQSGSLLIIDERKGRRIAVEYGLQIIGTVGVLVNAIDAGFVDSPSTMVARLEEVGFRLSDDLKRALGQ